jgi:hypothetical protein
MPEFPRRKTMPTDALTKPPDEDEGRRRAHQGATTNPADKLTKLQDDDEPCRSAYQGATRRAQAIKDYSRFSSSQGAGGFPWGYGPEFGVALSRGPAINA